MSRQIKVTQLVQDLDYYSRNLLAIKTKTAGLQYFRFNPVQHAIYYGISPELKQADRRYQFAILDKGWLQYQKDGTPLREFILKARQQGISTLCESRLFQKVHTKPGTNALVVAQDDEATSTIFQMARTFYSYLPAPLQPQIRNSNARELLFQNPDGRGGLNSSIKTQTAGWKNIGRGKTIHHLHLSEVSYWPQPEAVTDGLFEAVPSSGDTSIIIETTAEGLGSWAYNAWLSAKEARENKSSSHFAPVFIPWFLHPDYAMSLLPGTEFAPEDKDFKEEYGLTWEQVHWYKTKLSAFEMSHPGRGIKFMRTEYPSNDFEPWQSAGESAFPDVVIEMIYKYQVQEPEARFTVVRHTDGHGKIIADPNGKLRIWERQQAGVQYAIGVDTSSGVGQDFSVISVIAHPGYRQVAEWSSNRIGPKDLAVVIEAIARYYNEAVVAVEVNHSSGMLANITLLETYSNLYRWEVFDKQKQAETQKLGWETTSRTKELLIDHANSLFIPQPLAMVRSENVAEEMRLMRLVSSTSGMTHYTFLNHTGDHLMAWLIGIMCMWRKIARYDMGETVSHVPVDVVRGKEHLYDTKIDDLMNGKWSPHDEFYGNAYETASDGGSWMMH